jgi:hypothetical protein
MLALSQRSRPVPPDDPAFLAALLSDADHRLAIDPRTGLNRYMCPPLPADGWACFASCTASPISADGLAAAWACYRALCGSGTPGLRERQATVEHALLATFGAGRIADARLLPSGTDAVRFTAGLLASEAGARPITAILPAAAETGSGVPNAAAMGGAFHTVEIPLRVADGTPRDDDDLARAYAAAVAAAPGRAIVYVTHGSKTGLVAPLDVPAGAEVVVDACQGRIAPATVRRYLLRGWPVIVTGSKFFGGPAFAGAVLLPHGRRWGESTPPSLGVLLRWTAALQAMQSYAVIGRAAPAVLERLTAQATAVLAALPGIALVPGPSPAMITAGGWPASIITFALRDPADPRRLLSADELRPLYRTLAGRGVLLGQPVALGSFGGLRLAIGARDVLAGSIDSPLARVVAQCK